jgi:hypothetical protein
LNASGGGVLDAAVNLYDCNERSHQKWTSAAP